MFRKELNYILNHYGQDEQLIKFKEEEYELKIAIYQHKLAIHEEKHKGHSRFCSAQTREHLIEELADVTVVSLQIFNDDIDKILEKIGVKHCLNPFIDENKNEIENIMKHKIERTIIRINEKKLV